MPSPKQTSLVFQPTAEPKHQALSRAYELLGHGTDSVNSLHSLYESVTQKRGPGAPTHEDQDLLRAMLVMAGATLDVVVKQVIADSLRLLTTKNEGARKEAAKHIHRRFLKKIGEAEGEEFAEALFVESTADKLTSFIVEDFAGQSLQSTTQLRITARLLGLTEASIFDEKPTKSALEARNQVVHEMDAILGAPKRKAGQKARRQRKKKEMVDFSNGLLAVAAKFVRETDKQLGA